jgi:hypothetical protein
MPAHRAMIPKEFLMGVLFLLWMGNRSWSPQKKTPHARWACGEVSSDGFKGGMVAEIRS